MATGIAALFIMAALMIPITDAEELPSRGQLNEDPLSPRPEKRLPAAVESAEALSTKVNHRADGGRITIQQIADPGLVFPQKDQAARLIDAEPPVVPPNPAAAEEVFITRSLSLSATVLDHRLTYLCWNHEGQEYTAWSNVNFHHLSSVGEFHIGTDQYSLFLGLGDLHELAEAPWLPPVPALPEEQPGFVLIKGVPENVTAMRGVVALHRLYTEEGERLRQAFELRHQRHRALDVKPREPVNTRLMFWKREGVAP